MTPTSEYITIDLSWYIEIAAVVLRATSPSPQSFSLSSATADIPATMSGQAPLWHEERGTHQNSLPAASKQ